MNLGTYSDATVGPAYKPGYGGAVATPGQAAPYVAYKTAWSNRFTHEGHRLGQLYNAAGTDPNNYADRGIDDATGSQLTVDANYIPAGTESLTRIVSSMFYTTQPATSISPIANVNIDAWTTGLSGTAGLYCASCHAPHGTSGYMLPAAIHSPDHGKLLSSRPNHRKLQTFTESLTSTGKIEDWDPRDPYVINGQSLIQPNDSGEYRTDVSNWDKEGNNWCSKCHDKRMFASLDYKGNAHYNHPDTRWAGSAQAICLFCHTADSLDDFPHVSQTANLLPVPPDQLCIQCHTAQTLP